MPPRERLPERWKNVPIMRSTFLPRPLPMVISDVDGLNLIGPFCQHCGNREEDHSLPGRRCPRLPLFNLLPAPCCGCHGLPNERQEAAQARAREAHDAWTR